MLNNFWAGARLRLKRIRNYLLPGLTTEEWQLFWILIISSIVFPTLTILSLLKAFTLEQQRRTTQTALSTLTTINNRVSQAQETFSGVTGETSLLDQALPDESDPSILLNQLGETLGSSHLAVSSLRFDKPKLSESGRYYLLAANLEFTGTFQDTLSAITSFETNARLFNMTSLRISREVGGARLGVNLQLTTYSFPAGSVLKN